MGFVVQYIYLMAKQKGYKILTFRDKNGEFYKVDCGGSYTNYFRGSLMHYTLDEMLLYTDGFLGIYSVKRLSDEKIFELYNSPHQMGKVTQIDIDLTSFTISVFIKYPTQTYRVVIEK